MAEDKLNEVLQALKAVEADSCVPKNVKAKINSIVKLLEDKGETHIKVSRAMHELEELSEDANLPSFTRTQLFQITSLLEVV